MENMKKMILAAVVGLVVGQTVVAHEGCQAPVAQAVQEETPVITEENTGTAVTDGVVTTETEEVTDTDSEDSEVENLLNQMESEKPAQ